MGVWKWMKEASNDILSRPDEENDTLVINLLVGYGTGVPNTWSKLHGSPEFDVARNQRNWDAMIAGGMTEHVLTKGQFSDQSFYAEHDTDSAQLEATMGTKRQPPLTAKDVKDIYLGPEGKYGTAYRMPTYVTSVKVLNDDVFLRQYLGLTEEDVAELNRDVRKRQPDSAPPP
jgi:hypothetical protein